MEKLFTVEDIATMTSLTSRTIRNYLKDGILKGRKIGGQWRFTEEEIKNFMDNSNYTEEHLKEEHLKNLRRIYQEKIGQFLAFR